MSTKIYDGMIAVDDNVFMAQEGANKADDFARGNAGRTARPCRGVPTRNGREMSSVIEYLPNQRRMRRLGFTGHPIRFLPISLRA